MKRISYTIICMLLMLVAFSPTPTSAQKLGDNTIYYHSFRSPFASHLNPALFPSKSHWYVSLPNVDLGLSLPLSYKDLGLTYDPERDATILNVNHIIDQIRGNNLRLNLSTEVNVLGFGFRLGEFATLHVNSGVRIAARLSVPTGLFEFLESGNAGENKQIDFGAQNIFSIQAYDFVSLGGSWRIPELPISVGARVNVLNGIQNISVDNLSLMMTTAEDMQSVQMRADYLAHTAGLVGLHTDDSGRVAMDARLGMPQSYGLSWDVGARAKLGMFELSLSLIDLGRGIFWRENPLTIVPKTQEQTITFDGVDMTSLLNGGSIDTAFLANFQDSLMNMINFTTSETPFWTNIPTKLYFGANATFLNMVRVGYLFHGEWDKHAIKTTFRCNNTLSAHVNLMNWLELAASNSFTYDGEHMGWFNPGVSLMLSIAQRLEFHVGADYISSIYLTDTKSLRVFLGINIVGKSVK